MYQTMKEIGMPLGLTSHQVGKRLKQLGLRTAEGRPSREAFARGLVNRRWSPGGVNYLWAWRAEVVTTLLDGRPAS